MIVYRENVRLAAPQSLLRRCAGELRTIARDGGTGHGRSVFLLADFGELEAGVADALFPDQDRPDAAAERWRHAAVAVGRLFRSSWRGEAAGAVRAHAATALAAMNRLLDAPLPATVRVRTAEGYAYYGLYPETYLAAAEAFARGRTVGDAVCIGLRSIGTSLSAVVAAELEATGWRVRTLTVRPHGHPFDRRPVLSPDLAASLAAQPGAWFLIVDEGPGLSGSSFCGTAEVLVASGVAEERIVFFPSWQPSAQSFRSPAARRRWPLHSLAFARFEDAWLARGRLGDSVRDLSAGAWRALVYQDEAEWPAVQPQHERRKYLGAGEGEPVLFKFAGLGRWGEATLARARVSAEAGFGPPVTGLRDGFLIQPFVPGRPLRRGEADAALLTTASRYLVHRAATICDPEPVRFEELCTMIRVNVGEGLGAEQADRLGELARFRPLIAAAPAVAVDGRMLPHEWLRTAGGYLKTDGVDHAHDHFFPGRQDIAWDLAGFAVEFALPGRARADLTAEVAHRLADRTLPARLPFYTLAYLACRLGYCTLAAETLGAAPEGARFAALARRYRRLLGPAIRQLR
jgi:hypothetical protein